MILRDWPALTGGIHTVLSNRNRTCGYVAPGSQTHFHYSSTTTVVTVVIAVHTTCTLYSVPLVSSTRNAILLHILQHKNLSFAIDTRCAAPCRAANIAITFRFIGTCIYTIRKYLVPNFINIS